MFRKIFIVFLMTPLLIAAVLTGMSFPVVLLMGLLILIALAASSARDEYQG